MVLWKSHSPRRRRTLVALAVVLVVAALTAVPVVRQGTLRRVGEFLVVNDPLGSFDVIVLTTDVGGAGVLEAADLVRSGVSARVAVFAAPPDAEDLEFIRRGVPYEDAAARSIRQLTSLGVAHIERIPRTVTGTEAEGDVLPGWCDEHGVRSMIVVSNADHSRRLRRVLRRSMSGHNTRVSIRPARFSSFDPEHWWETRAGLRIGIVEVEKLLLDFVRHPIS